MQPKHRRSFKLTVTLAALLHDSGHFVFSHAGERALKASPSIRQEFEKAAGVFEESFPDPVRVSTANEYNKKLERTKIKAKPAELLSAMFILSPSLQEFISKLELDEKPHERDLVTAAALVLGRPYNLIRDDHYYHFIKCLVSGDLDADKIDYVGRDAFYTGIPTASDVTRILSRLRTIEVRAENAGDLKIPFGGANPKAYHLFSISTSAVSALEMFVATRAYLFERIYCHQKVRTAELMITRAIGTTVKKMDESSWPISDVLWILLDSLGDDSFLRHMSSGSMTCEKFGETRSLDLTKSPDLSLAQTWAKRIQTRSLPRRALAFAERLAGSGSEEKKDKTRWPNFSGDMSDKKKRLLLEKEIRTIVGAGETEDVFLDWAPRQPIEEDPEVWIEDPAHPNRLGEVRQFLNVEQQANAYQGVKQIDWVFSPRGREEDVAAATSVILNEHFGLILSGEALTRAKVPHDAFLEALTSMQERKELSDYTVSIGRVAAGPDKATITSLPNDWAAVLPTEWNAAIKEGVAAKLAKEMNAVGLSAIYQRDYDVAIQVFKHVLRYASTNYGATNFEERANKEGKKLEATLSEDFQPWLKTNQQFNDFFRTLKEAKEGAGFIDYLCVDRSGNYREVIIELKAQVKTFKKIVEESAGQPLQYMTPESSRVAILAAYFVEEDNLQIEDTIQIWKSKSEDSRLAVICLGIKQRGEYPSKLGKEATPAAPEEPPATTTEGEK